MSCYIINVEVGCTENPEVVAVFVTFGGDLIEEPVSPDSSALLAPETERSLVCASRAIINH